MFKIMTTKQYQEDIKKARSEGKNERFVIRYYENRVEDAEILISRLESYIFDKTPQPRDAKGRFVAKPKPANDILKYRAKYGQKVDISV